MPDDADSMDIEALLGRMSTASELSEKIKTGDFVFVVWREDGSFGGGWLGDMTAEDLRWIRLCMEEIEADYDDEAFGVGDDDGPD